MEVGDGPVMYSVDWRMGVDTLGRPELHSDWKLQTTARAAKTNAVPTDERPYPEHNSQQLELIRNKRQASTRDGRGGK